MSFAFEIPVRFQDMDAAGVLFFGRIYDYCHQAYEEFWPSEGVDRGHLFTGAEYVVPVARAEADYRKPIRYGDRLRIELAVARVGRASFTLRYRLTGAEGLLCAEVSIVHAFVSKAEMKPIPIPSELRSILTRHLIREPPPNLAP